MCTAFSVAVYQTDAGFSVKQLLHSAGVLFMVPYGSFIINVGIKPFQTALMGDLPCVRIARFVERRIILRIKGLIAKCPKGYPVRHDDAIQMGGISHIFHRKVPAVIKKFGHGGVLEYGQKFVGGKTPIENSGQKTADCDPVAYNRKALVGVPVQNFQQGGIGAINYVISGFGACNLPASGIVHENLRLLRKVMPDITEKL